MADPVQDPNVPVPTGTNNPSFTQRLFSTEVGIAAAVDGVNPLTRDVAYEWSNGRKFFDGPGAAG